MLRGAYEINPLANSIIGSDVPAPLHPGPLLCYRKARYVTDLWIRLGVCFLKPKINVMTIAGGGFPCREITKIYNSQLHFVLFKSTKVAIKTLKRSKSSKVKLQICPLKKGRPLIQIFVEKISNLCSLFNNPYEINKCVFFVPLLSSDLY